MKKKMQIFVFKRFTIFLVALLATTTIWGQGPTPAALSGDGTVGDPWQISTYSDWNAFATAVNDGYFYDGEYVQLTTNIEVTCSDKDDMVGWRDGNIYYSFQGIFDGGDNTLTFNYNSTTGLDEVAPFRYIQGATIHNLNVAGFIDMGSTKYKAGGLFFVNDIIEDSRSYINDCTVSITITGDTGKFPGTSGGFASNAKNVTFTNCLYNGLLQVGSNSGGISAEGNNKTYINYCLCDPAAGSEMYTQSGTLIKNAGAHITKSYYTLLPNEHANNVITGKRAYTSEPAVFTKKTKIKKDNDEPINNVDYWIEGDVVITDLHPGYSYTGNVIPVSYGLTFDGTVLEEDTDFTSSISPSPVNAIGSYTLTLTGNHAGGHNYYGSISKTFVVVEGLIGAGTEESPYLIYSASDWEIFTEDINKGVGAEAYYKLVNDITVGSVGSPIDKIVGSSSGHPFSGHFDGNFHTLEIYINRTENYAAPFGVIYGATIENLAVEGTVISNKKYLAGIAAMANYLGSETRTNNITNCISSVDIYCNATEDSGDCSTGGFLGQNEKGTMNFTNCIFDGTINGNSGGTTQKCGGFVNYNGGTINYNHCTMAGRIINVSTNKATFNRGTKGKFTNAYYITPSGQGDGQGTQVTASTAPIDGIYRKYTVSDNNYYVQKSDITGDIETTTYSFTGDVIPIGPFVLTNYGWTLVEDTDYEIEITYCDVEDGEYNPVDDIQEPGFYKITIAGRNGYGGSKAYLTIHVINIRFWRDLQEALASDRANIALENDFTDTKNDGALVVSGTIVLDLNGHTIDRNRASAEIDGCVIKVENTGNLTIINSEYETIEGVITGGNNNPHGGGIYNLGTLTLNNVVVADNTSSELGGGIYCGSSSHFIMNGGTIRNNTAIGDPTLSGGGGIHAEGSSFEMNNATVTGNISQKSKGAGIRLKISADITINNCIITNNEIIGTDKESKGGGIHYDSNTDKPRKLTITDSEICDNTVYKDGGGIFALKGTVELNNCILAENEAGDRGGAVYLHEKAKLIMNGSSIYENESVNKGGGVFVYSGGKMLVQGAAQVIGNTSTNTGAENVFFANDEEVIQVLDDITGANIGVSRSALGTISHGLDDNGTEFNFISDDENRRVMLYENEAYLQRYYIWEVTPGWPDLTGVTKTDDDYVFNAVVAISKDGNVHPNKIEIEETGLLIIDDGGQLVYTNTSYPIKAIVQKSIEAATDEGDETKGWYTIASPVNTADIASATTLITPTGSDHPTFDLLLYDEPTHYWGNYHYPTGLFSGITSLTNGRGYMYRNVNDVIASFKGDIHSGDVTYAVSYTPTINEAENPLKGFNLIGNPFTHNITFENISLSAGEALTGGYILKKDGEWGAKLDVDATIAPCEGVLVQVTAAATATISHTAKGGSKSNKDYIGFTVANSKYEDVAYALFDKGHGLNKIDHINPDVPMVYINYYDKDYAIATLGNEVKSFDLNFKAKTMGSYTLGYEAKGEFKYLHIIDRFTGKDIDMLEVKEYSFIASPSDDEARFVVRLQKKSDEGMVNFAYQSGNDIIVSGEGELQVFDMLGRFVMSKRINGVETVNVNTAGVYILRLVGDEILTQKIVVK